ncbi:MAG: Crp/Fnr family transcriptional regulator [Sphingomonadaceae bacterium]|nr:Crp/Fnr family transcriptional regulator [Sphingomonadaceae bacterium]
MDNCETCLVRNRAICSALEPDELRDLSRIGRTIGIEKGETVIWEGDDAPIVANVVEGMLQLSTSTSDGREQIVGVVYPSDFIGRPFGATSGNSVTSLTDARLCVFTRAAFDRFAQDHPKLEHELLTRTLSELDRARQWLLFVGQRSASERVASFLLEMSRKLSRETCIAAPVPLDRFDLPLGRRQIADILGLTIETVSRQLRRLRDRKIIDVPGRRTIEIQDRNALEHESGRD